MGKYFNKDSRNSAGVTWSGGSSGGSESSKPCDKGGSDHGNNVMTNGYTWKTVTIRNKTTQVRYKIKSCKRCGRDWEEKE